jgi:hypothetical protein
VNLLPEYSIKILPDGGLYSGKVPKIPLDSMERPITVEGSTVDTVRINKTLAFLLHGWGKLKAGSYTRYQSA